jgi:ABC-2 type transport system permease protein
MKKVFLIGLKDLTIIFRDRAALILMLLAPFALTIGLGLVTGNLSNSSDSGISHIRVVLVNQDKGQLGNALVEMFQSSELTDLVDPTLMEDASAAKALVDSDKITAAVIIPKGFSNSIIPTNIASAEALPVVKIELYKNPNAPTSTGVIQTLVESQVGIEELISSGRIQLQQAVSVGTALGSQLVDTESNPAGSIQIKTRNGDGGTFSVNTLALIAPGMALMFLMYTVTYGARSLLVERSQGTLPRLFVSPTRPAQILGGKVFGIFLSGLAQMLILTLGTAVLFKFQWGNPLGLIVLIVAAVLAATSWGLFIASFAKTPGQISSIGSSLMLIFGILGGGFFSMSALPEWVQIIARISPNAWGMDGFTSLALGGNLASITTPVLALLIMAAILFFASILFTNRRGFAVK